ncbi:MAG: YrdB family protein, partial [Demequinaceae bacterium]|nr:YrdB family protein [Demequinaceae bacterium]
MNTKWVGATLVFLAELGMLAGLAWWGFRAADGAAAWLLAVALPSVAVTLWGQFLAPKAPRRLKGIMLPFVRLNVLLVGALAAYLSGAPVLGVATAACAIVGAAMAGDLVTTPP